MAQGLERFAFGANGNVSPQAQPVVVGAGLGSIAAIPEFPCKAGEGIDEESPQLRAGPC